MRANILLAFALLLQFTLSAQKDPRGLIGAPVPTGEFEFIPYTGPTGPPPNYKAGTNGLGSNSSRSASQLVDSLIIEDIIPAGTTYTIKYDHLKNGFTKISPVVDLTADGRAAIQASPRWLQNDLYDNLRRLDTSLQKEYAQLIINSDALIRDEVAFQVAHLSTNITLPAIDKSVLTINAQGIYQIAPDLKYVKLVESGSVQSGDWHTTTTYRIINANGDTVWREIPRDIYYWWVLMPTIYEETPRIDSTVGNEFWRTHVYHHADSGYPVLKDVLKDVTVFWDGKNYHWDNRDGNTPLPFYDTMTAVQIVGRWVAQTITEDAIAPRPVQPNVTLYDHNGNCGEIQQMQTSGGRAGLFPLMPVCTWPGDHIWNEIYWPDSARWAFYQIARVGGPTDINWTQTWTNSACITAIRADGYRWMVNENYNPVGTVTVVVRDNNLKPVDGAQVTFVASPSFDTHSLTQSMIGSWGHTNENGELTVQLGTGINYFIRADWENGHYPTTPTIFYTLQYTALAEGDHKWIYLDNGQNNAADTKSLPFPAPQPQKRSVVVEYEVPYKVTYGGSYWDYPSLWQDNLLYAHQSAAAALTSFSCDEPSYELYNLDEQFDAFTYNDSATSSEMMLNLKDNQNYYFNLSNSSQLNIARFAKIKAYLYQQEPSAVSELNDAEGSIRVFPNPSTGTFYIENLLNTNEDAGIEILNSVGSVVYQSTYRANEKNKALHLSGYAKGIYMLRVHTKENTEVRKLVLQ